MLKSCREFNNKFGNDNAISNWQLNTVRSIAPPPRDKVEAEHKAMQARKELLTLCTPPPYDLDSLLDIFSNPQSLEVDL